jgi:hypothetical protein
MIFFFVVKVLVVVLVVLVVVAVVVMIMVVVIMVVMIVIVGMVMVTVFQRAVDVRDAAVEVFVGLPNHSPANQHPHIAEENGERVGIAFLRQCFGRNEESADCGKRHHCTRGGGNCELSKVGCHTFLLPKQN